jgi:hypothetical protein
MSRWVSAVTVFPQRKRATKFPNMKNHTRHSPFHYLFRFIEWREGFLNPIFCSYDDLRFLIGKMLLHHWISISECIFHQHRHLTKCIWQTANGGVYSPALKPAQSIFYFVASGLKILGHKNSDNNLESCCFYLKFLLACKCSTRNLYLTYVTKTHPAYIKNVPKVCKHHTGLYFNK